MRGLLSYIAVAAFLTLVGACLAPSAAAQEEISLDEELPVVLVPQRQAILSAQVSSSVVGIHKEMGQSFTAGEILIRLDDIIYQANLKKAKAKLASAVAHLKAKKSLFADNAVSVTVLEDAKTEKIIAEANLAIAQKQLDACSIRVPYLGRIVKVMVNEQEVVQPGQKLIEVVDDQVLLAQFLLPQKLFHKVRLGDKLTIALKNSPISVQATISNIGAVVDPASSTVKVFAKVSNKDAKLRGGMLGTVSLTEIKNRQ